MIGDYARISIAGCFVFGALFLVIVAAGGFVYLAPHVVALAALSAGAAYLTQVMAALTGVGVGGDWLPRASLVPWVLSAGLGAAAAFFLVVRVFQVSAFIV